MIRLPNYLGRSGVLPRPLRVLVLITVGLCFWSGAAVHAQSGQTGSVEGRVVNADTGRYIANATVALEGTGQRQITNDFGEYQIRNVPAGTYTLRTTYSGWAPMTQSVTVRPGETVVRTVNLRRDRQEEEIIELDAFEVRGGDFRTASEIAFQEERFAANIKNVVSADSFGEIQQGNVAEFVKFIPGILIGYGGGSAADTDATAISIRGFPPHQTNVMVDGISVANTQPGSLTRQPGLDTMSINNASRVEVTKVPTPDMPMDAIGGSINLISKSAFEYAEPTLTWSAFLNINSEGNYSGVTRVYEQNNGLFWSASSSAS